MTAAKKKKNFFENEQASMIRSRLQRFQTFELPFCVHNKLYSLAEILSKWAFVVTFPWIQPSGSEVQSAVSFERE